MTPDELSTLLKRAGRPVDSPVDPVPLIRHRALAARRRRVIATAGTLAAVVIAGLGIHGQDRSTGLPDPIAPTTTDRSPRAQGLRPEEAQGALLPERLGDLTKVTDLKVPSLDTDDPDEGSGPTQPGDEVRIAYMCKGTNAPAGAQPYVLVRAERAGGKTTHEPLRINLPHCLLDLPQVASTQIPAGWPSRKLYVTASHRGAGSTPWSVDAMGAVYRKPPR